jgi:methylated-DNA-protein-cysteine methyltransferase-like protein
MGVMKKTKNQIIKRPTLKVRSKSGGTATEIQGKDADAPDLKQLIWQTVALIPKGRVASYGQIASLVGYPRHARYVGSTLKNLPKNTKLPWFRVVNGSLRISQIGGAAVKQRKYLEAEEITFIGDKIAKVHRWEARND